MQPAYDCNCDTIIEMEELGVGTEEILQYSRALFSRVELLRLLRGLEDIVAQPEEVPPSLRLEREPCGY